MLISSSLRSKGLCIALLVLILDQLSKYTIMPLVQSGHITVLPFFNLVEVWNRGISFGMLNHESQWNRIFLLVVATGLSVVLYHWLKRAESKFVAYAIGAVLGGAIGNIIDRIILGAVFDFLDFHAYGYHWPAFNIADSAICLGVICLMIDSLFISRKKEIA